MYAFLFALRADSDDLFFVTKNDFSAITSKDAMLLKLLGVLVNLNSDKLFGLAFRKDFDLFYNRYIVFYCDNGCIWWVV